jgi:hypothetical protein
MFKKFVLFIIFALAFLTLSSLQAARVSASGCACWNPNTGQGDYCYCGGGPGSCPAPTIGPFCGCGCPDPCAGNTQCGQCGNPACCTVVAPGAATPTGPANGATNLDLPINFTWTNSTGWGNGCPNTNTFAIFTAVKSGPSCPAPGAAYVSVGSTTGTSLSVSSLLWGRNYCWYVQKNNRSAVANSIVQEFTTTPLPSVSNIQLTNPGLCGPVAISGRTDSPNANNPITLSIDFTDTNSNFGAGINRFNNLRVAVIPTGEQNSNVVPFSVLDPALRNRLGFRANVAGATSFSPLDSAVAPYFGPASSAGNLPNAAGTATLLSLNNATSVQQIGNQTLRVTWQVRFENTFPTADDNIYIAAVVQTPSGNLVSQDAQGVGATMLQYRRALNWETDMAAPAASVSAPVAVSTDTFTLRWSASDTAGGNNGLRDLRSYCYVDDNPTSIFDQTLGQMIALGDTTLAYPNAGNCLISGSSLGTHTYTLSTLSNTSDMHFSMYVEDGACNPSTPSNQLDSPAAWIVTSKGVASAQGGYNGFKIRNIATLSGIVPNLGNDSFLSTYAAMAGNNSIVSQLQSKHNFYTTQYDDKGALPPEISDADNWYDYLFQLVSARQTIDTSAITTINGSISAAFGGSSGATLYKVVNNDLTLLSGSRCDANLALFVNGNLTIQPDLTKANNFVACAFVVKGNVNVEVGTTKTSPTALGQPAQYDVIEGAFLADGKFTTSVDQTGAANSWTSGASTAARGLHSMVVFNDKLYAWGGYNGVAALNTLAVYDIATNTWSTGTSGGTARYVHTSIVYNGKMYAWGGIGTSGRLNTMDVYDLAAGTWSTGPTGGTARYGHTAVLQGDKMYVWGGETSAGVRINTMDIFNFTTNTWSVGVAGGSASVGSTAVVLNNKMHVWGGSAGNVMSIFDFGTNTWSAGTTAGSTQIFSSAVVFSNKMYIWAGIDSSATNRVDIYDPSVPQWTFGANGGTARYGHTAVATNGRMYAFGGVNVNGAYIGTMDIYDFGSALGGDGLYIRGTVYANELDLQRNLGLAQNGLQPAEVFDYDPAYARIFRSIFGIRTFSLRAR